MIASVVPIVRIRRDTGAFSYKIPTKSTISVGSLVIIPFHGRQVYGIVWEILESDPKAKETINEVVIEKSLFNLSWRRLIEWLSLYGFISLSTAVFIAVPSALRRSVTKPVLQVLKSFNPSDNPLPQTAIFLPGANYSTILNLKKQYPALLDTFLDQSELVKLKNFLEVAEGKTEMLLGRESALFAVYANLEKTIFLEPEDIFYYRDQAPYISMLEAGFYLSKIFNISPQVKSRLPLRSAQYLYGDQAVGIKSECKIKVIDIKYQKTLSDDLITAVQFALSKNAKTTILLNAHDQKLGTKKGDYIFKGGVEQFTSDLLLRLNLMRLPKNLYIGTRSFLGYLPEKLDLAIIANFDSILQKQGGDFLHALADIGALSSRSKNLIIQSRDLSDPLINALSNNLLDQYLLEFLHDSSNYNLPPFGHRIVIRSKNDLLDIYNDLIKISGDWQVGSPSVFQKQNQLIIEAPSRGARPGIDLKTYLVRLQKPVKVLYNPLSV